MEKNGKWHGHARSNWDGRLGRRTGLKRKEFLQSPFPPLFWKFWAVLQSSRRRHVRVCFCTREQATHSAVPRGQFLLRTWYMLSPKNNCWEFVVVLVMFSCLQSLAWVVFPAIFLSYQPYNFIVIIHCGMSLDTHPSHRLCQAHCLLICWINGFRQSLVSFCFFFLIFEIFVSKEKAQIFPFEYLSFLVANTCLCRRMFVAEFFPSIERMGMSIRRGPIA